MRLLRFFSLLAPTLKNLRRKMPDNLCDLWLENVRLAPDATAVIDGESGSVWSRARLQAAAEHWLETQAAGLALARRRVALAEPNGPGWLAVFIGMLRVGAIVVPLDPAEPAVARAATAIAAGANWL